MYSETLANLFHSRSGSPFSAIYFQSGTDQGLEYFITITQSQGNTVQLVALRKTPLDPLNFLQWIPL